MNATVSTVLQNLNAYIEAGKSVPIRECYEDLSIFDWWKDNLTLTDMKNMKRFLKTALELGFNGYTCFKVGAVGCANGMWAHTEQSKDGYSPDTGDVLYRSFTPSYISWDAKIDGEWLTNSGVGNSRECIVYAVKRIQK